MSIEKRKPIFFTSDTHYFHANSIVFDKRPFANLDEMHAKLISNFNATVPEHGLTYFLGDISMGNHEQTKEIISQLNGTLVCISGNHDKGYNSLYSVGFDVVMHNATIYLGDKEITMSHCPLLGVFREDTTGMRNSTGEECWHGDHKNQKYSVQNEGQFHLHGHIHSTPENGKQRTLGRQFDVGVPANGYKPVSLSQVEKWINNYKE